MTSNRKLLLENENKFKELGKKYYEEREACLPASPVEVSEEENEFDLFDTDYTGYRVAPDEMGIQLLQEAQKRFGYNAEINDETLPGIVAEKKRLERRQLREQQKARKSFLEKEEIYQNQYKLLFPEIAAVSLKDRLLRLFKIKPLVKIAEKLGMGIDDVPAAASSMLEVAGPFLLSGAGFFVFTSKIVEGIKEFDKALNNKELTPTEQYTELATSLLQISLGVGGLAVSGYILSAAVFELLSELVHVISVVQSSIPYLSMVLHPLAVGFAPLGVPAILSVISAIELYQASSSFHFAKERESKAKEQYETILSQATSELTELNKNRLQLENQKKALLEKVASGRIKKETLEEIQSINVSLAKLDDDYFALKNKVDRYKQAYEIAHKNRVKAERELGFASTEMILSLVVLTLFAMTVLTTTGVFSFGAVPGFVLLGVVGAICAVKLFEVVDKIVFDSKGTTAIRNFAINTGNKIKNAASDLWKKCTNFFSPPPPGPAAAPVPIASGMNTRAIQDQMKTSKTREEPRPATPDVRIDEVASNNHAAQPIPIRSAEEKGKGKSLCPNPSFDDSEHRAYSFDP